MPFLAIQSEMPTAAGAALAGIGSVMSGPGDCAAVTTTMDVIATVADEVSALTGAQLATQTASYQAVRVRAAASHQQFVAPMAASAGAYPATEAANAVAAG